MEDDVVLNVTANVKGEGGDKRVKGEGERLRMRESQFPSLTLTCLVLSPTSLLPISPQPPVLWSKDGVYLHQRDSTIYPATISDPTKTFGNGTPQAALSQGVYWCKTWVPRSPILRSSNKVLVTLEGWEAVVVTVRGGQRAADTTEGVVGRVREVYETKLPGFANMTFYPVPVERNDASEYRFRVHFPTDSPAYKSLSSATQNKDDLDRMVETEFDNLNMSISFACLGSSSSHDLGNSVKWPSLSEVGDVSPLNYRCEVKDERLEYGYCRWNDTHGASIEFEASKCNRFDFCPKGFKGIDNHLCVGRTDSGPWEYGFISAYQHQMIGKVSNPFQRERKENHNLDDLIRDVIGDKKTIWLPIKRLVPWGPLIIFDNLKHSFSQFNESINNNWSWDTDQPRPEDDCVALNLKSNRLSTRPCQESLPFVSKVDVSGLDTIPNQDWMSDTPGLIVEDSPFCNLDWSSTEFEAGDRFCFRLFTNEQNVTWKEAQEDCEKKKSTLPTPNMGFLDFVYRQYLHDSGVDDVWMSLEPPNPYHSRDQERHYINWLPKTDFKLENPTLTQMGWRRDGEGATKSNILCQMDPLPITGAEINLHRSNSLSSESICVDISQVDLLKDGIESVKCFVNGKLTRVKRMKTTSCELVLDNDSEGFYQCLGWMEKPKVLIESNVLFHKKPNTQTFAVTIGVDEAYIPLLHDSSFSLGNQTKFHHCVTSALKILSYSLKDFKVANIKADNVYHSQRLQSLKLNINFQINVEFQSDNNIIEQDRMLEIMNDTLSGSANHPECSFLGVRSTGGCIREVVRDFGLLERILTWPATMVSKTVLPVELCISQTGEPVTRECKGSFLTGYVWGINVGGCAGENYVTKQLWEISQSGLSANISLISSSLSSLTMNGTSLNSMDIHLVTMVFQSIAEHDTVSDMDLESIVQTLNNIMEADSEAFKLVQNRLNSSSILFEAFEKIIFKIKLPKTKGDQIIKVNRALVSVVRIDLATDSEIIGYQSLVGEGEEGRMLSDPNIDIDQNKVAIIFPNSIRTLIATQLGSQMVRKLGKIPITIAVYNNSKLFQDSDSFPNFTVNSRIIQATFSGYLVQNMKKPVKLLFKPNRDGKEREWVCVFWDIKKNSGRGGWSKRGCRNGGMEGDQYVCYCNHFTSFAQLMKFNDEEIDIFHAKVLDVITYIGCILSAISLILVFATFVFFKKWRKPLNNRILVNLALSVFLSLVIFLVGINQTGNALLCRSVAVALHYFILASFGWMLVEAVHQYLKFVKVIGTYIPRFIWKASACAWGLPFLPIIAILAYDATLYDSDSDKNAKICWMSNVGFIYAFLLPLVLTMAVNLVMFGIIIYSISCGRVKVTSTMSERVLIFSQLRMAISVFFLLGFTWIFGLLAFGPGHLVFSYLFCIFNTLQGFFIFLFHIFRERTARKFWWEFLSKFTSGFNSSEQPTSQSPNTQMQLLGHSGGITSKQSQSDIGINPNQMTNTSQRL